VVNGTIETSFEELTSFAQEYLDPVFVEVLLIVYQLKILLLHNLLDFGVSPSLKISICHLFVKFILYKFSLVVFDVLFDLVKSFKIALGVGDQKVFLFDGLSTWIWGLTIIIL